MLQVANGGLDGPGGFAAGPADRVKGADGIEDGAADPEDGVRLEGGRRLGLVGVDGPQQPENSGLHRVLVVEEARDRDAQPADDVLDEVGVASDQLVAAQTQIRCAVLGAYPGVTLAVAHEEPMMSSHSCSLPLQRDGT